MATIGFLCHVISLFLIGLAGYGYGKKVGYTMAVKDVCNTGKFRAIEEVL